MFPLAPQDHQPQTPRFNSLVLLLLRFPTGGTWPQRKPTSLSDCHPFLLASLRHLPLSYAPNLPPTYSGAAESPQPLCFRLHDTWQRPTELRLFLKNRPETIRPSTSAFFFAIQHLRCSAPWFPLFHLQGLLQPPFFAARFFSASSFYIPKMSLPRYRECRQRVQAEFSKRAANDVTSTRDTRRYRT